MVIRPYNKTWLKKKEKKFLGTHFKKFLDLADFYIHFRKGVYCLIVHVKKLRQIEKHFIK